MTWPIPRNMPALTPNSFMETPESARRGFQDFRRLVPTAAIARGAARAADAPSLSAPVVEGLQLRLGDECVGIRDAFDELRTEGLLVSHKGETIHEEYLRGLQKDVPHTLMSASKSVAGTLAVLLRRAGALAFDRPVASYVPELSESCFGSASVEQLLSMEVDVDYPLGTEDYNFWAILGRVPYRDGYSGPTNIRDHLKNAFAHAENGDEFYYHGTTTLALCWVLEKVGGAPLPELLAEHIWANVDAEHDAYVALDPSGLGDLAGGMSATLRDFAAFGRALLSHSTGLSSDVLAEIQAPGGRQFTSGWRYKYQWWLSGQGDLLLARGLGGQWLCIVPEGDLVVAHYGLSQGGERPLWLFLAAVRGISESLGYSLDAFKRGLPELPPSSRRQR